jgi:tRNA U54 and U55 pseudouridine synthase Pus10
VLLRLKEGEETKRKRYVALCVTAAPYQLDHVKKLETFTDLAIQQETPIRVLHRRSNAIRSGYVA